MADKYPNFATLALGERSGIDYRVLVRRAKPAFAIIASHGGAKTLVSQLIYDPDKSPATNTHGSRSNK
jgi:phage replication-related protein YjqB (UPF0714/DUF867 family)